ncbi:MAG: diguanylate cyclase [Rhodobacterales bacterium]|nr:MAG: diguanylate cyclase [Rhodobacterales bacterium]
MALKTGMSKNRLLKSARRAVLTPHLAALLPAIMLISFWLGGEEALLGAAIALPTLIALIGLTTRRAARRDRRDSVSGLPGRGSLIRHLDTCMDPANEDLEQQVCLILAIDDFDTLEAQYGREASERIERSCADRLKAAMREEDVLVQIAPGTFGLAINKTRRVDLETMIQLSARLQEAISEPVALEGTKLLFTASVGFALPNRVDDQTGEALLGAAESALNEAHKSGPNSIRAFSRGMRPRPALPSEIALEISNALENGEIRPWFQPQISTDTGELTGFEALARWHHPTKGMIAPGAFLPTIERGGLSERLGEVILFHALTAIREWDRAGLSVPNVAVNFSPAELQNPKLHEKIKWELDRFDIAPNRLTVEVLEDVVAQSEDDVTCRNVAALSQMGCTIDLDDFGTGHASIGNIRRFKVNRIKIDRSFVTHVDTDRDQQNMVAAIQSMAERLGLETLGEGVESEGEHSMLAQLGCGHVQGYSIAKPMPFEKTTQWIAAHAESLQQTEVFPRQIG